MEKENIKYLLNDYSLTSIMEALVDKYPIGFIIREFEQSVIRSSTERKNKTVKSNMQQIAVLIKNVAIIMKEKGL